MTLPWVFMAVPWQHLGSATEVLWPALAMPWERKTMWIVANRGIMSYRGERPRGQLGGQKKAGFTLGIQRVGPLDAGTGGADTIIVLVAAPPCTPELLYTAVHSWGDPS